MGERIRGNGQYQTREYQIGRIDSVRASNGFDVTVTPGPTPRIKITTDANIMRHVEVRTEGTTLVVELEEGRLYTTTRLRADIALSGGSSISSF